MAVEKVVRHGSHFGSLKSTYFPTVTTHRELGAVESHVRFRTRWHLVSVFYLRL